MCNRATLSARIWLASLQMGYTCSGRYANHKGGKIYEGPVADANKGQSGAHGRAELPRTADDPQKAESARIFCGRWQEARTNPDYLVQRKAFQERYEKDTN